MFIELSNHIKWELKENSLFWQIPHCCGENVAIKEKCGNSCDLNADQLSSSWNGSKLKRIC